MTTFKSTMLAVALLIVTAARSLKKSSMACKLAARCT